MTFVALETSARRGSVAVQHAGRSIARELSADSAHASDLVPAVKELLSELGAEPGEMRAVFVGTGPGSYTGLRVGIATALGLAMGSGAKVLGVPSGETLCFAELGVGEEGVFLLDARQCELYFARYRRALDDVEVVVAPCITTPQELPVLLEGDFPIFAATELTESAGLSDDVAVRLRSGCWAGAAALLQLGQAKLERDGAPGPEGVEPLYLRPFAAKQRRR